MELLYSPGFRRLAASHGEARVPRHSEPPRQSDFESRTWPPFERPPPAPFEIPMRRRLGMFLRHKKVGTRAALLDR